MQRGFQTLIRRCVPRSSRSTLECDRGSASTSFDRRIRFWCLITSLSAVIFPACASYQPPSLSHQPVPLQLASGFSVPRDSLLQALVEFSASSRIFVLDHVDSSSGTVLLRVNPDSSRDFIDCGHFNRPWIPYKYRSFNGPYKEFLLVHRVDASLAIRLSVILAAISPNQTRVSVSGNFELKSRQETSVVWTLGRFITWDFGSGRPKTNFLAIPAWGSGQERTCRSTLEAEAMALQTIGKLAERLSTREP